MKSLQWHWEIWILKWKVLKKPEIRVLLNVRKQMTKLLKCMIKYRQKTFRKFLLFIILRYVHSLRVFKVSDSKVSTGHISTNFVEIKGSCWKWTFHHGSRDWTIYIWWSTLVMTQNYWFNKNFEWRNAKWFSGRKMFIS